MNNKNIPPSVQLKIITTRSHTGILVNIHIRERKTRTNAPLIEDIVMRLNTTIDDKTISPASVRAQIEAQLPKKRNITVETTSSAPNKKRGLFNQSEQLIVTISPYTITTPIPTPDEIFQTYDNLEEIISIINELITQLCDMAQVTQPTPGQVLNVL
jgi:hypothetical protein